MKKGKIGYIDGVKKRNFRFGITGMAAMFMVYLIGLMVTGTNASYATLAAVLMALPAAQMLTRYLSLRRYKSLDPAFGKAMEARGVQAYYEMVVVYGKKTFYVESAAISPEGLEILTKDKNFSVEDVKGLLRAKGISVNVRQHRDPETYMNCLVGSSDSLGILDRLKENAL